MKSKTPKVVKQPVEMYITGVIDESTLKLLPDILALAKTPQTPLKLIISSPGGEEAVGFALFDALCEMPNRIETVGYGDVSSIAVLLFSVGTKRTLSANCTMLLHDGSVEINGSIDTNKIVQTSEIIEKNNERYYQAIANRIGCDPASICDWCINDTHFEAGEALDAGLATHVQGLKASRTLFDPQWEENESV